MATRLVYTSPEHFGSSDAIDVLSPKQLDALLKKGGYSVIKRSVRTVPHPKTKRPVKVEYLELATESQERGVTAAPAPAAAPQERGITTAEDIENAVGRPDNGSYLGGGSAFQHLVRQTGVGVASTMGPEAAFGMGVDAAKLGHLASSCPFRQGTIPGREWMKGFTAAGGDAPVAADPNALAEAYNYGKTAAKGAKDLEVTCPYPEGTDLFGRWLDGFKAGGGDVQ